jgi:hypothetical protein
MPTECKGSYDGLLELLHHANISPDKSCEWKNQVRPQRPRRSSVDRLRVRESAILIIYHRRASTAHGYTALVDVHLSRTCTLRCFRWATSSTGDLTQAVRRSRTNSYCRPISRTQSDYFTSMPPLNLLCMYIWDARIRLQRSLYA